MSNKSKEKDHRRQKGGKGGRGLSPAELEAQDALQLGRQAEAPAQDAPVVATASAGEETPAEAIEPGGRQDPVMGDLNAVEVAPPPPAAAPARPQGRVSVLGLQGAGKAAKAKPAASAPPPSSAPARPRRETLAKVWGLLTAALLGLWAGLRWLGRKVKATGAKVALKAKTVMASAKEKSTATAIFVVAVLAILLVAGLALWQGSLAYDHVYSLWSPNLVAGKSWYFVVGVSLAAAVAWVAALGLVVGSATVLACWLVVKLWNVAIATAMAFGFKPAETGLVRKHEGPVKALALVGKIWDKIYGVLVKDTSKTAISALNVVLWIVLGALALAFLAWCAQAVINFFN